MEQQHHRPATRIQIQIQIQIHPVASRLSSSAPL
uniref:Uncharacterized protein n=1 Tax=Triticum urartu TaxID=4572 RepID=A0A8R7K3P9_TRIUA